MAEKASSNTPSRAQKPIVMFLKPASGFRPPLSYQVGILWESGLRSTEECARLATHDLEQQLGAILVLNSFFPAQIGRIRWRGLSPSSEAVRRASASGRAVAVCE